MWSQLLLLLAVAAFSWSLTALPTCRPSFAHGTHRPIAPLSLAYLNGAVIRIIELEAAIEVMLPVQPSRGESGRPMEKNIGLAARGATSLPCTSGRRHIVRKERGNFFSRELVDRWSVIQTACIRRPARAS